MIAALNERRFGLPRFSRDPARTADLRHRQGTLRSAARWTTAVFVWIAFLIVPAGLGTLLAGLEKIGWTDAGWSLSIGSFDTPFELTALIAMASGAFILIRRRPRLGLAVVHYGSIASIIVIVGSWDSFVHRGVDGVRVDITGPVYFVVLAALSGIALWKSSLAKGAFGPQRENG